MKLADLLKSKGSNEFWRGRENYKIILGLLWGSNDIPESNNEKTRLYDYYHTLVKNENSVYKDLIIGIETLYAHGKLKCSAFYKAYNGVVDPFGRKIVQSLV